MSKKKEPKEEVVLTEWQKRNLEFLQRKKEKEAEEEEIREKLRVERLSHVQNDEDSDDKAATKKPKPKKVKQPKKEKVRKELPTAEQKARKRALPIFIISGLVLVFSLFLVTPLSKMKHVTVKGAKNTTADSVIQASGIRASDYFLSLIFKHGAYEKAVVANDVWVKNATLTYHFPIDFTLKVKEHGVLAYTHTDDGFQSILENGARAGVVTTSQLPEEFLTINLTDDKDVQQLVQAFEKLDKKLVNQIQIVSSAESKTTKDLLVLDMHDGNTVRVPLSELTTKLPYYNKVKGDLTETGIVDMEVGIYTTNATIEAESEQKAQEVEAAKTAEKSDGETVTEDEGASTDAATAEEPVATDENAGEATAETAENQ